MPGLMMRAKLGRSRERSLPYVYLAPSVLVIVVFGLLPVAFTAVLSLFSWDAGASLEGVRFDAVRNYFSWALSGDHDFRDAFSETMWHALMAGVLVHASAIPLAAFINQAFRRSRPGVLSLYFLPFLTSGAVIWVIVMALFSSTESGVINSAFTTLGNATVLGVKPHELAGTFGIIGIPLVDARANFITPIKFGDVVDMATRVSEFRRSSFDVEHRLSVSGALAVEGAETRVWATRSKDDPEKIGGTLIPPDVIAKFGSTK